MVLRLAFLDEKKCIILSERFFWVSMSWDIAKYVCTCTICASTKASNWKVNTNVRGRRPHQIWKVIALDIMGPFPRTPWGKTNILVVTDLFTHWVEAFAIPEATTNRTLTILNTEVFSWYGYQGCGLSHHGVSSPPSTRSRPWKIGELNTGWHRSTIHELTLLSVEIRNWNAQMYTKWETGHYPERLIRTISRRIRWMITIGSSKQLYVPWSKLKGRMWTLGMYFTHVNWSCEGTILRAAIGRVPRQIGTQVVRAFQTGTATGAWGVQSSDIIIDQSIHQRAEFAPTAISNQLR